jgi:hypothetical protein
MKVKTIDGKQVFSEYLGHVEMKPLVDNITNVNTGYLTKPRFEVIDGRLTGVYWWEPHSLYHLPHGKWTVSVEEDFEGNILEVALNFEADAT